MTDEAKGPKETPPQAPSKSPEPAPDPPAPPPAPPRAGPLHPSPEVPPPPAAPVASTTKGSGPSAWMATVAVLLLIFGLAAFAYSAYSYVSGMGASLHAGERALLSIKAHEEASATFLSTQETALAARAIELKREAITASDRADNLHKAARVWGFVGIVPLIVGLVLMIFYRRKRASARRVR